MTTTVTEREIRSPHNGRVPRIDSPPAPARAGARLPVTVRVDKAKAAVVGAARRWWVWTAQPASLADTWRASAVDPTRVPAGSTLLLTLWRVSNWTDRLLMFGLLLAAPTALTGPLRWLAARPTRRWGFYLTIALHVGAYLLGTLGRS